MSKRNLSQILSSKHQSLLNNRETVKKELAQKSPKNPPNYEFLSDIKNFVVNNQDKEAYLDYFRQKCLDHLDENFLSEFLPLNEFSQVGNTTSPMYGVPISIKEAMAIKGHDSTCGLVKNCFKPAGEDSIIVKVLKHIGAIPFITTSMAQGGLSIDSSNPIFGVQENPRFKGFLAGGSSGGEGIAISLGASPIGVGSDVGGSIRFPAAFNGICGLKPTFKRLSGIGHYKFSDHLPIYIRLVIGPMGRKVEDLADFMRGVLCDYHFKLDPEIVPLKFNEERFSTTKLKVGYYDGFNEKYLPEPVPGVKRGIAKAVSILKDQGHDVNPFYIPNFDYAIRLALSCLFADGGSALKEAYKNEILDASNKDMGKILKVPRFLRKLFGPIILKQHGKFIASLHKEISGFDSYLDASKTLYKAEEYRKTFLKEMQDFDVIICPLFPVPIPKKHSQPLINNIGTVYSLLYNLLDLPAGVVPVDITTDEDIKMAKDVNSVFREINDVVNYTFHETQEVSGQPLYVQVVGKPFMEEVVLCAMKQLEMKSDFKLTNPK